LNDYEKVFVLKMGPLRKAGIDFEALAREALTGKFGGATDVMLRGLSPDALREPEYFVKELSRIFGGGAVAIYEPIAKYVDMGLYGPKQDTPVLGLLRQLGQPQGGGTESNAIFLHEHRVKDEEGNYSDNAD
jgi:hypothetical protein